MTQLEWSTAARTESGRRIVPLLVWGLMLLVSLMPDIVLNEWLNLNVGWLGWGKTGLIALALASSLAWERLRPLRILLVVLLALLLLEYGRALAVNSALWQTWFDDGAGFTAIMLGDQLLRVAAALLMIGLLLLLRFRPAKAYLRRGNITAPVRPIPLLAIKEGEITWARFGWLSALAIGAGTLLFLVLGSSMQVDFLPRLLPLLPAVLLFATMNAFAEEVMFRAALLAPLRSVLGKLGAVWVTAVFFGFAHFYGVPYGVLGVVMATFLGWLLGKGMVETNGFFWPWFIHFVQDVLIFSFIAVNLVVPGG